MKTTGHELQQKYSGKWVKAIYFENCTHRQMKELVKKYPTYYRIKPITKRGRAK